MITLTTIAAKCTRIHIVEKGLLNKCPCDYHWVKGAVGNRVGLQASIKYLTSNQVTSDPSIFPGPSFSYFSIHMEKYLKASGCV